ncbi:hypothetical protein KEK_20933 [Mycolicibacterium thermoresistibile ATCC 19527]|uniref:Uncharacterized protein n=1 Tax=Mycolicibacterium thermoresistibile (strain ATCC 19527 / DSM 44167 / CIP 105390 / JCM 6362 / NCTC 10409 / 316) TaxID=1078020 RepID=G7CME0_MYCT3|nr:hypothetical protein KEK_20933 [Mycolicibacterium thermoresistibile ATCC 19527]
MTQHPGRDAVRTVDRSDLDEAARMRDGWRCGDDAPARRGERPVRGHGPLLREHRELADLPPP